MRLCFKYITNGFSVVYPQLITMYGKTVVVRFLVTGPDSNRGWLASTPKYHAADKHYISHRHFKLTLDQLGLLYHLNGER